MPEKGFPLRHRLTRDVAMLREPFFFCISFAYLHNHGYKIYPLPVVLSLSLSSSSYLPLLTFFPTLPCKAHIYSYTKDIHINI